MPTVTYDYKLWEICGSSAFKYLKSLEVFKNKKIPEDVFELHTKYIFLFMKEGHRFENKFFKKWIKALKPDVNNHIKRADLFDKFFKMIIETPVERQARLMLANTIKRSKKLGVKPVNANQVKTDLEKAREQKLKDLK